MREKMRIRSYYKYQATVKNVLSNRRNYGRPVKKKRNEYFFGGQILRFGSHLRTRLLPLREHPQNGNSDFYET